MVRILHYTLPNGRIPFTTWLNGLRDSALRVQILLRIERLVTGNFGDSVNVGEGVIELRIHKGQVTVSIVAAMAKR